MIEIDASTSPAFWNLNRHYKETVEEVNESSSKRWIQYAEDTAGIRPSGKLDGRWHVVDEGKYLMFILGWA